ncbi:MAG TPA: hypothetical protein VHO46_06690 [Bacteroidales bacterium]|nr:hypothetical protein [Bacteroidales bacterium]
MFIKLLILSVLFLVIAAIGFGITILLKPKGKFPELHISNNKEMTKRGITCASRTDIGCSSSEGFSGCSACSGRLV